MYSRIGPSKKTINDLKQKEPDSIQTKSSLMHKLKNYPTESPQQRNHTLNINFESLLILDLSYNLIANLTYGNYTNPHLTVQFSLLKKRSYPKPHDSGIRIYLTTNLNTYQKISFHKTRSRNTLTYQTTKYRISGACLS